MRGGVLASEDSANPERFYVTLERTGAKPGEEDVVESVMTPIVPSRIAVAGGT